MFLLTLAIIDDIGAIPVTAIFYASSISFGWLAAAVAAVVLLRRVKVVHQLVASVGVSRGADHHCLDVGVGDLTNSGISRRLWVGSILRNRDKSSTR